MNLPAYQNFVRLDSSVLYSLISLTITKTVTIPSAQTGPSQFNVAHFYLIGVSVACLAIFN